MRLKVTVRQPGQPDEDVLVVLDTTATIGDLARHVGAAQPGSGEPTLRVTAPGSNTPLLLNPLTSVHESPLRSGWTAEPAVLHDPTQGSMAVATAVVVDGPDAGRSFPLQAGVNYVGRSPASHVRLSDPEVSRRHATITIAETTVVAADLNSANGLDIDGRRTERAQVGTRTLIQVGDTTLRVLPAGMRATLGGTQPLGHDSADRPFTRSPRVDPVYRGAELTAPELPSPAEKPRFPLLAIIAPIILGSALFFVTWQPVTLLFIALSPIIMLGTWIDGLLQNRRRRREESSRFEQGLAALTAELDDQARIERRERLAESPSAAAIAAAIRERGALVWTRKPEHAAFGDLRFGTGALCSRTRVASPTRTHAAADEWARVTALIEAHRTVAGVPVVENLDRAGAIGVAGDSSFAVGVARALVIQLATLHSPADLVITAIGGPDEAVEWGWLKWLPHVDSPHSPIRGSLSSEFTTAGMLLAELEELVAARRVAGAGRGEHVRSRLAEAAATRRADEAVEREPATPTMVVVVLGDPPVDGGRLVQLGEEGADYGVHLVYLARETRALPVVCRTFVDVAADGRATVGFVREGRTVDLVEPMSFSDHEAAELARLLAPLEDAGSPVLDESDLPRQVAFVDLFDESIADDSDALAARWLKNDSLIDVWTPGTVREPGGIRALVGQGPLEPLHLDLRRHGPHALVGGTTGSGKSEFLQTWILGMAVEYSPDRVTFLLVDYKGGAAFADCVDLPHTVGLVTDLNGHLVRRALTSLRAELRHRERLLNAKGAKDLETLESRSDPETPPALIIVIDEFAALAAEVPEFVDGVLDIAQRGRSLGLHLVMATQRPAGVIKDSLRANTNLRIALRVADDDDSRDVIGVDRAARFDASTPGRAAAKLGPGKLHDFQTAYLGGRTNRAARAKADIDTVALRFGPGEPWPSRSVAPETGQVAADDDTRDITRMVRTIRIATATRRVRAPRRPWLDQLPDIVDLGTLTAGPAGTVAVGLVDEPESQRQRVGVLDFDRDGSIAVFGAGASGKSTLLRTVAVATSIDAASDPVHVYALDFAGGALATLETLPTVGAVIDGADTERLARLISHLTALADDRSARFASVRAANLTEYRAIIGDREPPRVLVLLDGMSAFRTEHEFAGGGRLFDSFTRIVATGRQLGIHVIVTADRQAAFPTQLLAVMGRRLVLRLATAADYAVADVPDDVLTDAPPGRALLDGQEMQLAVPGGSDDLATQATRIEELATTLRKKDVPQAPEIARLPDVVRLAELPRTADGLPVFAISDETLGPATVPDGLFVVTGPFDSGRTTAMRTIVESVCAARPELAPYLVVARRSALTGATRWAERSADADQAESLATRLAAALELPHTERDTNRFIVIENSSDFEGLAAEVAVARLLKAARRADVSVLVETDTITSGNAWQIHAELKTARAGIVLQPEETDGFALFRVQFPRVTRADFPKGRGLLVDAGRVTRVQVALPVGDEGPPATPRGMRTQTAP
ncbi:FtsK/SpoIIIE domain-containing protein [Luethyella okanaganae]|uniref:FtsK/SpoIIIE domain-containing protein n=1 Tax=Luethyella okanaganae TaxID=69372 RepID=A0ABW1VIU8_9MICO